MNTSDTEVLIQFAEDWIGSGASARIPTYGVIAHGVRTNAMDMIKMEDFKRDILQDNKVFILAVEIRYV